jgi:hypothetical protein
MNQYVNITKKIAVIIVLSCFVAYAAFAQDTIEQINCSGVLQENGQLLTGSKDLTFSIEDTEWEQTIPEVQIQKGIYSVKLDAPPSVFWSLQSQNKQANLEVSIDGTPLTPKTTILWVPYAYLAKRALDTLKIAGNPVTGTPQTNYVLKWNGTEWEPAADSGIITESDPVWSKASSNYYNITDLNTPGNAQIHWDNLNDVPEDIKTDAQNVASAGALMDGDFSSNGIMKRTGSGSYGVLDANSGRTFLGLGSAATRKAEDTITNGSNLPDGAAIIAHTSKFLMDSDFTSNGIMKRTNSGTYSIINDSSSNWNIAYNERRLWDGSSSNLNATTGRSSLGLGSAATRNAEDSVSNGSNLPDGAAIVNYVASQIPDTSKLVTIAGNQTITGQKIFDSYATFNETTKFGNSSDTGRIEIFSDYDDGITFYTKSGSKIGEIGMDTTNDNIKNWVFAPSSAVDRIRFDDDVYIGWPRSTSSGWIGRGELTVANEINAYDYINLFIRHNSGSETATRTGRIFGMSGGICIRPEDPEGNGTEIRGLVAKSNSNDVYLRLGNYIKFTEGASWAGDLNIALGSSKDKKLIVEGYIETTKSYAYKPGSGSWTTSSDLRLKDIIKNFDRGLEAIELITPIVYKYKEDNLRGLPTDQVFVGAGAQVVQKSIPEAVQEDEKGYLTVNNDPIIWTMLNSIKQLSSQNKYLKAENETLKQELSQIKQMIAKIQQSLNITQ